MDKEKEHCNCNHDGTDHQNECSCGCNHEEDGTKYIYLTLDDDSEVKCIVLGIFDYDNQDYIALIPEDEEIVFIYKYDEDDNGPILSRIESDEEFERISNRFSELFE